MRLSKIKAPAYIIGFTVFQMYVLSLYTSGSVAQDNLPVHSLKGNFIPCCATFAKWLPSYTNDGTKLQFNSEMNYDIGDPFQKVISYELWSKHM